MTQPQAYAGEDERKKARDELIHLRAENIRLTIAIEALTEARAPYAGFWGRAASRCMKENRRLRHVVDVAIVWRREYGKGYRAGPIFDIFVDAIDEYLKGQK